MQLPQLTLDQIRCRCTEQSFERGLAYFHDGAIGNPVLHGWTLSATCRGSTVEPYRVTVELMPTGILATDCSCLYSGHGDCKHSVALLHTYREAPETICTIEKLLVTLAGKPKSSLLHIISELLKRAPALAPIAQVYADVPGTPLHTEPLPITAIYTERIDRLFGDAFLEQHQLQQVLSQLEGLRTHAASLLAVGETAFALALLYALIHQSIVRYPDTLQKGELPQFVSNCTKTFAQIVLHAQHRSDIREYCRLLLDLSFDAAPVFIPHLTHCLAQCCLPQHTAVIERRLDESPNRRAHVELLLACYLHAGHTERYLCLTRNEGESYRLIHALFTDQQDAAAWEALEAFPMSVDEYGCLLESRIAKRVPHFTDKLLTHLRHHAPETAVLLYHKLIEAVLLSRKRENYEAAFGYLKALRALYQQLDQADQWCVYITRFRKQHARKRLLRQLLDERNFT